MPCYDSQGLLETATYLGSCMGGGTYTLSESRPRCDSVPQADWLSLQGWSFALVLLSLASFWFAATWGLFLPKCYASRVPLDIPSYGYRSGLGRGRFNSLFYILQRQRPDLSLRVCHRLDRLTSGLVILAKTSEKAGVIQTHISELSSVRPFRFSSMLSLLPCLGLPCPPPKHDT